MGESSLNLISVNKPQRINRLKRIALLRISSLLTLPICCFSHSLLAAQDFRFSGFITAAVAITDNEETYQGYNNEVNYGHDSIFGLQIDRRLSKDVRVSAQLVANDASDFDAAAEWLYIHYQISPTLEFRAGRLRLPIYQASQHIHVGTSYLWVAPPPEVYGQAPFTRYHGFDLIHRTQFDDVVLDVQFFSGRVEDEFRFFGTYLTGESKELYGINFITEGDNLRTRVTYVDTNFRITATPPLEFSVKFMTVGLQYEIGNWETMFEWARRDTDALPIGLSSGAYLTIARSIGDWMPYVTYAFQESDDDVPAGLKPNTKSVTVGLRFDDVNGLVWKADLHHGKAEDGEAGHFTFANATNLPEDPTVNLLRLTVSTVF